MSRSLRDRACCFRRLDYSFLHACHSCDYGDYGLRKADCIYNQEEKITGKLEDNHRPFYNSFRLPRYTLRHKSYNLRLVSYRLNCLAWILRLSDRSRIVPPVVAVVPTTGGILSTRVTVVPTTAESFRLELPPHLMEQEWL
jgi:hypothetical protein